MRRTLPPPIALRAFESAARLLSFTRAAEELSVTQAAVSHQIKVLEEFFGFPLFVRLTRKLMLTHEGQSLYAAANEGFGIIENTVSDLLTGRSDETLDISLTPYFSSRWLSPRLGRFWESHPNIDLRLHHTSQQELRPRENIDLSITWGLDDWPNLDSAPLLHARVVPVCSPSLVRGKRAIRTVDDLYRHNLLHETDYSFCLLYTSPSPRDA